MAEIRSPADSPSRHITVVDVYDLAASIGKDFERIIDEFGNDSVRQIMPKVCFVCKFSLDMPFSLNRVAITLHCIL